MTDPVATFLQDMKVVREKARAFPVRRSDADLYGVLAATLHLCARVDREGLLGDLKARVVELGRDQGKRRAYFEKNADAPLVVCRLVFEQEGKRRDAAWRYTAALREARAKQIAPGALAEWLTTHGGINALFRGRRVESRNRTTRTLHLRDSVTLPKEGPFTLTLEDAGDGFYRVVSQEDT